MKKYLFIFFIICHWQISLAQFDYSNLYVSCYQGDTSTIYAKRMLLVEDSIVFDYAGGYASRVKLFEKTDSGLRSYNYMDFFGIKKHCSDSAMPILIRNLSRQKIYINFYFLVGEELHNTRPKLLRRNWALDIPTQMSNLKIIKMECTENYYWIFLDSGYCFPKVLNISTAMAESAGKLEGSYTISFKENNDNYILVDNVLYMKYSIMNEGQKYLAKNNITIFNKKYNLIKREMNVSKNSL